MKDEEFNKAIKDFVENADSKDAWAVARLLIDMRTMDRERMERAEKAADKADKARRVTIICCTIALIACLITGIVFAILASGIEIDLSTTTTTTTTTTVEQDTGEGGGDAVYQAGENARYYASGGDFE